MVRELYLQGRMGVSKTAPVWRELWRVGVALWGSINQRRFRAYLLIIAGINALMLLGDAMARALRLHGIGLISRDTSEVFLVTTDDGVPEWWGYIQLSLTGILLAVAAVRSRSAVLGAWAAIIWYMVADDALGIHERGGAALSEVLSGVVPDLPGVTHMGELLYAALAGGVVVAILGLAMLRSTVSQIALGLTLLFPFGCFAVFAVGLDVVHDVVDHFSKSLSSLAGVIEDGGELLCMGLFLTFGIAVLALVTEETGRQQR